MSWLFDGNVLCLQTKKTKSYCIRFDRLPGPANGTALSAWMSEHLIPYGLDSILTLNKFCASS